MWNKLRRPPRLAALGLLALGARQRGTGPVWVPLALLKRGHYRVAEVEELVLQGEHAAHTTSASRDSSILDAKLVHPRVVGAAVSHLNDGPHAGVQSNSRSTESRC